MDYRETQEQYVARTYDAIRDVLDQIETLYRNDQGYDGLAEDGDSYLPSAAVSALMQQAETLYAQLTPTALVAWNNARRQARLAALLAPRTTSLVA